MPEGDTVFRAARRLAGVLDGRELARFDLRVPQVATVDLTGATVQEVVPRGKHLLHRIDGWTLHTHLRMEGEWHVYERGGRWRKPGYKARAVLGTSTHDTVGFDLCRALRSKGRAQRIPVARDMSASTWPISRWCARRMRARSSVTWVPIP